MSTRTVEASQGMITATSHPHLSRQLKKHLPMTTPQPQWREPLSISNHSVNHFYHEHTSKDGENENTVLSDEQVLSLAACIAEAPARSSSGIDSGYVSHNNTGSSGNIESSTVLPAVQTVPQRSWLQRRRPTKLKPFAKPMPDLALQRFRDLMLLFNTTFYEYIKKNRAPGSIVTIKLKILGEEESMARPCIVVLCDKPLSKRVKRFFQQDWVEKECKPDSEDDSLPCLEVVVCELPPRPLGSKVNSGTIGGILKLEMHDGSYFFCGLTAGHIIGNINGRDNGTHDPDAVAVADEHQPGYEVDSDSESSMTLSEDDHLFELDLSGSESYSDSLSTSSQDAFPSFEGPEFGSIFAASSNLDWALVRLDDAFAELLSKAPFRSPTKLIEAVDSEFPYQARVNTGLESYRHGPLDGVLTSKSYCLLPGSDKFTEVYDLVLHKTVEKLVPGDSGAWVTNENGDGVYGHIVCSDVFGEASVVPLSSILPDIVSHCGLKMVGLPTTKDMYDWHDQPRWVESYFAMTPFTDLLSRQWEADPRKNGIGYEDRIHDARNAKSDLGTDTALAEKDLRSSAGSFSPDSREFDRLRAGNDNPSSAMPYSALPTHYVRHPPPNPADQNPPCNTLYVCNLPIDTSEEELGALFSTQRGYKRLCFRTKQNGPMCFVEFDDVTTATKALNDLYGHPLPKSVKGGIRISFSKNPLGVRTGQLSSKSSVLQLEFNDVRREIEALKAERRALELEREADERRYRAGLIRDGDYEVIDHVEMVGRPRTRARRVLKPGHLSPPPALSATSSPKTSVVTSSGSSAVMSAFSSPAGADSLHGSFDGSAPFGVWRI